MTFKVMFQTVEINFIFTTYPNDPNFVVKVMVQTWWEGEKETVNYAKNCIRIPEQHGSINTRLKTISRLRVLIGGGVVMSHHVYERKPIKYGETIMNDDYVECDDK